MLLQTLPCAGFDQMRQPLLAADIRPVQPSEILVAEHGKITSTGGSLPRKIEYITSWPGVIASSSGRPRLHGGSPFHLSLACAELLSAGTAGNAKRAAAFEQLLVIYIAEKYANVASQRADYRGGLPIARLCKIKQATAMTPLQFVTRERIVRAILLRYFGGRWA